MSNHISRLVRDSEALIKYVQQSKPFDLEHCMTAILSIANSLADYAHTLERERKFNARDTD